MKYIVVSLAVLSVIILARKPKEPTNPNMPKNTIKVNMTSSRS